VNSSKKPRVPKNHEPDKIEGAPTETFFGKIREHFKKDLPQKDTAACGLVLRALSHTASDLLSEDPSRIFGVVITTKNSEIFLHFPADLTKELKHAESYIEDLLIPSSKDIERGIEHSVNIVWEN